VSQGAVESNGTKMIYCLACGTANKDGSRFCDECGDQLTAQGAKRSDVPPWVADMEETLRTQAEVDDDGEPQEILEVPDWFRDLHASQPDRYVEEAFQLEVGENESMPAWLASVQGMKTSAEPPQEVAEPLQAGADFVQVDGGSVQPDADSGQMATESQQTVPEPLQAVAEPPQAAAQPPWTPAQPPRPAAQPPRATPLPPQAETEPLPAGIEPSHHAPKDRTAGESPPEWLQKSRPAELEIKAAPPSREGHDAELQSPGWLVETQTAEGAGEPRALAREGDTAEESLDVPVDPRPAAQELREDGALTGSEGSDRLLPLKLRALRDKQGEFQEGVIAHEKSSGAGGWLPDLADSLPVQVSILQGQGAAVPERETANPARFASRARVFSEIVAHPPQVAPAVAAQPEPGSRSRRTRYAIYAVLIVIALGAILAIAFGTRFSLLVGWIRSILDNLGGLIGG
jgi:hypothetical protein